MPAFDRGGLAFNYLDEGDPSGRPFVFQHGLGGDVPVAVEPGPGLGPAVLGAVAERRGRWGRARRPPAAAA